MPLTRNKFIPLLTVATLVTIVTGLSESFRESTKQSQSRQPPSAVRMLSLGQVVDGIPCLAEEQPIYHIHSHLEIIVNGKKIDIPSGIGIGQPWGKDQDGFIKAGTCTAWLHTHDTTGVIHVMAPEKKSYTLGQFFDLWGQGLSRNEVAGYTGKVSVYENQQLVEEDPRDVILSNHLNVVLAIGQIAVPANFDFSTVRY